MECSKNMNDKSTKISVISPSYNQAQFLKDNLDSVQRQTYKNVEHIIVDPGSSDRSRDIALSYPHITPLFEEDRGQSDGICKGFKKATGDILVWLNSDDFYPNENILLQVVKIFDANPSVDVVYGGVDFVDENNKFLKKGYVNRDSKNLFESFQYQVGIVQPGVFWRREVFDKLGGPSEEFEYCMDYELWVRFANAGLRWMFVDKTLAHHRWWDGMKTSSQRGTSLFEHFKVNYKYFGYVHWKWLDRYADFIASGADGVVNAAADVDTKIKHEILSETISKVVTQKMLANMERDIGNKEIKDTLDFISNNSVKTNRIIFDENELSIINKKSEDKHAAQRPAWNIFQCTAKDKSSYSGYFVPDNFGRLVPDEWLALQLSKTTKKFKELRENKKRTCIVVGNGPSLRNIDFNLFDNADVIISNFAIVNETLVEKAKFVTVVNDLVADQGCLDFNFLDKIKIFPFWLANSINADDNTYFVKSTVKPFVSEDFVNDSSWRSTVTFFNIQLAYSLGYEKVILVGVDNSYVQPIDSQEGDLISQTDDDENHFDPRYFKGKDWQAADTVNMEKMYDVANKAFIAAGREIVNCTVGGALDIFRRGLLEDEINFCSPSIKGLKKLPKVLVLDTTPIGQKSATGQIKQTFFNDWEEKSVLQIWALKQSDNTRFYTHIMGDDVNLKLPLNMQDWKKSLTEFGADVIYLRPVDDLSFLSFAEQVIEYINKPYVLHMMDDWPTRMVSGKESDQLTSILFRLINRASNCFSICSAMSVDYQKRYGGLWHPFHNGVDLTNSNKDKAERENNADIKVRYLGGAAADMNLQSLVDVAKVVHDLSADYPIKLEVYTMPWYQNDLRQKVAEFTSTKIKDLVEYDDYQDTVNSADILVILYNFDAKTLDYTKYSFANKISECLAANVPILVYGHSNIATVEFFKDNKIGNVVDVRDENLLKNELKKTIAIAQNNTNGNVSFDDFNLLLNKQFDAKKIRSAFKAQMIATAVMKSPSININAPIDSIRVMFDSLKLKQLRVSPGFSNVVGRKFFFNNKPFNNSNFIAFELLNLGCATEREFQLNAFFDSTHCIGTLRGYVVNDAGERVEVFAQDIDKNGQLSLKKKRFLMSTEHRAFVIECSFATSTLDVKKESIVEVLSLRLVETYSSLASRFPNPESAITKINAMVRVGDNMGAIFNYLKFIEQNNWNAIRSSIMFLENKCKHSFAGQNVMELEKKISDFMG
jgi:glycosyltransferase involved in cell wall biosynthesis